MVVIITARMFGIVYPIYFETQEDAEGFKEENRGIIDFC